MNPLQAFACQEEIMELKHSGLEGMLTLWYYVALSRILLL